MHIEVDTNHFKGNFPESFLVEARSPDDKKDHFPIKLLGIDRFSDFSKKYTYLYDLFIVHAYPIAYLFMYNLFPK